MVSLRKHVINQAHKVSLSFAKHIADILRPISAESVSQCGFCKYAHLPYDNRYYSEMPLGSCAELIEFLCANEIAFAPWTLMPNKRYAIFETIVFTDEENACLAKLTIG